MFTQILIVVETYLHSGILLQSYKHGKTYEMLSLFFSMRYTFLRFSLGEARHPATGEECVCL